MKKIYISLFITTMVVQFSFAQWTTSGTNIYNSNTGNVGIGVTNPLVLLQVGPANPLTNTPFDFIFGKGAPIGNTAGSYSYLSEYQQSSTGNINRFQTSLYRRIAGSTWQGTAYRLQFAVDNSFTDGSKAYLEVGGDDPNINGGGFIALGTAGSDRLVVTNAGGVGIGTTDTKGYLLAVNGSAIATSMTVKLNSNWPDYVFKPNYRLPDLATLKTYININHHLPDVPSADEIAKDGLDLGDMDKLLMKKTEELTLYLIEKDKQLKEQQAQIYTQQEQINLMKQQIEAIKKQLNKTKS